MLSSPSCPLVAPQELTEESIADEVIHHLAAAIQFCGFRSVVGTMWAMADIDGRDLGLDLFTSWFSRTRSKAGTITSERRGHFEMR